METEGATLRTYLGTGNLPTINGTGSEGFKMEISTIIYLDDVIAFYSEFESHLELLAVILERFKAAK